MSRITWANLFATCLYNVRKPLPPGMKEEIAGHFPARRSTVDFVSMTDVVGAIDLVRVGIRKVAYFVFNVKHVPPCSAIFLNGDNSLL